MIRDLNLKMELPKLYELIQLRKNIAAKFNIEQNYYGVYNDVEIKLKSVLEPIVERLGISNNQTIKIKLCGDGTCIGNLYALVILF